MLTQMYFAPDGALHTVNRPVSINISSLTGRKHYAAAKLASNASINSST